jgi:hypothetical protein
VLVGGWVVLTDELIERVAGLDKLFDQAVGVGFQRAVDGPLVGVVELFALDGLSKLAIGVAGSIRGLVELVEFVRVVGAVQLAEDARGLGGESQHVGKAHRKLVVLLFVELPPVARSFGYL